MILILWYIDKIYSVKYRPTECFFLIDRVGLCFTEYVSYFSVVERRTNYVLDFTEKGLASIIILEILSQHNNPICLEK